MNRLLTYIGLLAIATYFVILVGAVLLEALA